MLTVCVGLTGFTGSGTPLRSAPCSGGVRMSTVSRNANIEKLQAGYLFPEIGRRRNAFLEKNPDANIISLGIGDTTQPVPKHILDGLVSGASRLGSKEGYTGYGPEQGVAALRSKIAETLYNGGVSADEVFVSDGSKCDIGRLQMMFGNEVTTAVQARRCFPCPAVFATRTTLPVQPLRPSNPSAHLAPPPVHPHSPVHPTAGAPLRRSAWNRIHLPFGRWRTQDPSYPVYVDTSVIMGQTGLMDGALSLSHQELRSP